MLPSFEEEVLLSDFSEGELDPSLTYKISGNRIVGHTDGAEAVKQAIELMLSTSRFEHAIYSWDFGVELQELFGLPSALLYTRLESRIEEALMTDDRIVSVEDFSFSSHKNGVLVNFTANTVLGRIESEHLLNTEERRLEGV